MTACSMTSDQEILSKPPVVEPLPIARISGIGATARVVQGVSQEFQSFASAVPLLIAVREGSKTLRGGGANLEAQPGDMVVLPAHLAADIGNRASQSGPYVAELLAF